MKKPKHSSMWEEDETGSTEEGGDSMRDFLDEEIIDLEDIVEMPEGEMESQEDLDVDVEILDLDADLDFDDMQSPGPAGGKDRKGEEGKRRSTRKDREDAAAGPDRMEESSDEVLLDFSFADEDRERARGGHVDGLEAESDDVLLDFSFDEEGKDALENKLPGARDRAAAEDVGEFSFDEGEDNDLERETDLLLSELDDDLVDFSLSEEDKGFEPGEDLSFPDEPGKSTSEDLTEVVPLVAKPGKGGGGGGEPSLSRSAASGGRAALDLDFEISGRQDEELEKFLRKELPGEEPALSSSGSAAPDVVLDRLVSQIEDRLVASLREIVAEKLPDVVRSVLREEINRLRKETG